MFTTPAWAQGAGGSSDFMIQLLPILLMFVILTSCFCGRSNSGRSSTRRWASGVTSGGYEAITSGGIVGKVTKVLEGRELEVEISKDVRVRVIRDTLTTVISKSEPVKAALSAPGWRPGTGS